MYFFFNTTAIFAVGVIAVWFTSANTAPIAEDLSILPHPFSQPEGKIQQDSVPDPGIGDWFTSIFNSISKIIAKGLKDRDPKKIKAIKEYIKERRTVIKSLSSFIRQYYPDDIVATTIVNAINTFLASLEKQVEEPTNQLVHNTFISQALIQRKDVPSTKDKEMVTTFCRLLVSEMKYLHLFNTEFGEGSVGDYCDSEDIELPPEPRREEKNSKLAEAYQRIFDAIKRSGLDGDNIYRRIISG